MCERERESVCVCVREIESARARERERVVHGVDEGQAHVRPAELRDHRRVHRLDPRVQNRLPFEVWGSGFGSFGLGFGVFCQLRIFFLEIDCQAKLCKSTSPGVPRIR